MKAIISDIHSNLEALKVVLADIQAQGVKEIYCLGDVIGYGPNPCECLDLIMDCKLVILGNHDQAALYDPPNFGVIPEKAIYWTRKQLDTAPATREARQRRWDFLSERPKFLKEGDFVYLHGSPRNPLSEYIFPEDIYQPRKIEKIFALIDRYCFHGHTHVPGIFTENLMFYSPEDINFVYQLDGRKTLCNVGSVGQPRDSDPRACYVILDGDTITFRRVEYDFETTIRKIYDIPELDNSLGDRLREGR